MGLLFCSFPLFALEQIKQVHQAMAGCWALMLGCVVLTKAFSWYHQ